MLPDPSDCGPHCYIGAPFFNAGETISYARHSGSCSENGIPVSGFTSLSERTCSLGQPDAAWVLE